MTAGGRDLCERINQGDGEVQDTPDLRGPAVRACWSIELKTPRSERHRVAHGTRTGIRRVDQVVQIWTRT